MSTNYQNERPQARVNITLDVVKNNSQKKKELPMKLLILGDFSAGNNSEKLSDRPRHRVTHYDFNRVMSAIAPVLRLSVPNHINVNRDTLSVCLTFETLKDFTPEEIARHIPSLKKLLAMRLLLKDLKGSMLDNHAFRKALEVIMKSKEKSRALLNEIQHLGNDVELEREV